MDGKNYDKSKYSKYNDNYKGERHHKSDKYDRHDKHYRKDEDSHYSNNYSKYNKHDNNEKEVDRIYESVIGNKNNQDIESSKYKERERHYKKEEDYKNKDNYKYNNDKHSKYKSKYEGNSGKFQYFKNNNESHDTEGLNIFDINLNFYNLKNSKSKISCHARPSKENIIEMKKRFNLNYLVTIHSERENPNEIGNICKELGIKWKYIDLYGANMRLFSKLSTKLLLIKEMNDIYEDLITNEYTAFVHCAYGLHRTGTLVYSIIRMFGDSPESSYAALKIIREATWSNVGAKRLIYIEEEVIPFAFEVKHEKDKRLLKEKYIQNQIDDNFVNINSIDENSFGKLFL